MDKKWHFIASGRLFQILGRQSVSNEVGALFELIKNCYDADAIKVLVSFEGIQSNAGRIIIKDNGVGMTTSDFFNKFRVIATPAKIIEKFTPSGRRVVGEKGIGRIAMDRLGEKVTIVSKSQNDTQGFKTTINWERYLVEDVTIDTVGNDIEYFDIPLDVVKEGETVEDDSEFKYGLEVIIEILRDDWNKEKIEALGNKLGELVTPKGFKTKLPFSIQLQAKEFGIDAKPVKSLYLDKAMYQLEATLKGDKIQIYLKDNQIKREDQKEIYSVAKNNHIFSFKDELERDCKCKNVKYRMWGFPLGAPKEKEDYEKFYDRTWYHSALRDFTEENGGIKIYRDNFKVRPYGDKGNDWLGRERAQRTLSGSLPNRSMIGWVEISTDDNPELIDTTTREKILEDSQAYIDLVDFVMFVNSLLDDYTKQKRIKKIEKKKKDIPGLINRTATSIARNDQIPDEIKKPIVIELRGISLDAKEKFEQLEAEEEELMTKFEATRNLSSLGITVGIFAHEVNSTLTNLMSVAENIKEKYDRKTISKKDLDNTAIQLYSSVEFLNAYASLVRGFTSSLTSAHPSFRRKEKINVLDELNEMFSLAGILLKRLNILSDVRIPKNVNIYMYRSDFQSIFLNLLSNSVKAIRRKRREYSEVERRTKQNHIMITLADDPKTFYLRINFTDDGTGVKEAIKEKMFNYFVTDYVEKDEEASGSGLGLSLIKEIVESYDGNIQLAVPEFKPGATFQIQLPWDRIAP